MGRHCEAAKPRVRAAPDDRVVGPIRRVRLRLLLHQPPHPLKLPELPHNGLRVNADCIRLVRIHPAHRPVGRHRRQGNGQFGLRVHEVERDPGLRVAVAEQAHRVGVVILHCRHVKVRVREVPENVPRQSGEAAGKRPHMPGNQDRGFHVDTSAFGRMTHFSSLTTRACVSEHFCMKSFTAWATPFWL